jgi:PhnB protein
MRAHTYLNFAGNAEEAFKFYEKALGGKLAEIVRFRDLPMEGVKIPEKDQDKVMHVRLDLGNHQVIMASDTLESLGQRLVRDLNRNARCPPKRRRPRTWEG